MDNKNHRIIGPNEKYVRWNFENVDFDRTNFKSLNSHITEVCENLNRKYNARISEADKPNIEITGTDPKEICQRMNLVADHYQRLYYERRSFANKQHKEKEIDSKTFKNLKVKYLEYRDIAKEYRYYSNELNQINKSKDSARKYVASIANQLNKVPYAKDVLRVIPGEPVIPIASKKVYVDRERVPISLAQREKIRLALINSRILNWKWMDYQNHKGELKNATPYFLNALGKFYYNVQFKKSPDSVAKSFYQNHAVQNRTFSILHLTLLENFYRENGHDAKIGKYPFDLVVDGKHGFVFTEFHENSIGIEMRLSEAMFECQNQDMLLYLPAMNSEHRRRISSIMAGLFFEGYIGLYTYVTYLEPEICSNRNVSDWSYMRTKTDYNTISPLPEDVLRFPKVDIEDKDIVHNEMMKTVDDEDDKLYFGDRWDDGITTCKKKKKKDYGQFGREFKYPTKYINGLKDHQITHGVKVTVGIGQIGNLWRELSVGADVIVTGMCRNHMRDGIKLSKLPDSQKYPKLLIVNDVRDSNTHEKMLEIFESHGTQVKRLYKNHGKCILNQYQLLVHSMTTTNYMGNNRESFCLIDFSEHTQREFIRQALINMFHAYGNADATNFIKMWKSIGHLFGGKIGIFGHFSKHDYNRSQSRRKSGRTIKWVFYKELVKFGEKHPLKVYTSHQDMRKIARCCNELRIQGTSRFSNHLSNMDVKGPVIKERLWHPRIAFNDHIVALGSWDFSQILDQKELQVIIYMDDKLTD
ncbi:MAG: hypothetical protein K8R11_03165 [Methanococcoides sp.]|nr:hypothetical protein [Methanococcoides sp.]